MALNFLLHDSRSVAPPVDKVTLPAAHLIIDQETTKKIREFDFWDADGYDERERLFSLKILVQVLELLAGKTDMEKFRSDLPLLRSSNREPLEMQHDACEYWVRFSDGLLTGVQKRHPVLPHLSYMERVSASWLCMEPCPECHDEPPGHRVQDNTAVSSIGSEHTSVQQFIDETWNKEHIEYIQYMCERCKHKRNFAKKRKRYLAPFPCVLFFSYNRFHFSHSEGRGIKVSSPFTAESTLKVSAPRSIHEEDVPSEYALVCETHHVNGVTVNEGHYITYTHNSDNSVTCIDDLRPNSNVTIAKAEVPKSTGYTFHYVKQKIAA